MKGTLYKGYFYIKDTLHEGCFT